MAASHNIPSERDLELLSAYLDGALPHRERETLEQRLIQENALREALDDLRANLALMRRLPRLKAPRDFTLDVTLYGHKPPWWKRLLVPEIALQMTGALGATASLVLIVVALLSGGSHRAANEPVGSLEQQNGAAVAYEATETSEAARLIPASPTLAATSQPTPSPVSPNQTEVIPEQPLAAEIALDAASSPSEGEGPPPAALGAFPAPDSTTAREEAATYEAYGAAPGEPGGEAGFTAQAVTTTPTPLAASSEGIAMKGTESPAPAAPLESDSSDGTTTAAVPTLVDTAPASQKTHPTAPEETRDRRWLAGLGLVTLAVSATAFIIGRRKAFSR